MTYDGGRSPRHQSNRSTIYALSRGVFDRESLKAALKSYQYKSPNLSLFERLWLDEFWNRVPEWCYPLWLAPNLITFTGFCCITVASMIQLHYSRNLATGLPGWWFPLAAFCLFAYQTLDGSDGKQARRTKSGSALGELFDHGVDALVTSLVFGLSMTVTGFGMDHIMAFWGLFFTQSAFYFSNLTLLHFEKQEFNNIDCQEVQVVLQLALLLTWWCPSCSSTSITLPSVLSSLLHALPVSFLAEWGPSSDLEPNSFRVQGLLLLPALVAMCCNNINAAAKILSLYRHSSWELPERLRVGQGLRGLAKQCKSFGVHGVLSFVAWRLACDAEHPGTNTILAYFIVSTYAFGDLMNHALVTRVGQLTFPAFYTNRGAWVLLVFCVSVSVDLGWKGLGWVVALGAVAVHTQYSVMMASTIANLLEVNIFTIRKATRQADQETNQQLNIL